jgi:hypothetical protein
MMVRQGVDPRDHQRQRRREAVDLLFVHMPSGSSRFMSGASGRRATGSRRAYSGSTSSRSWLTSRCRRSGRAMSWTFLTGFPHPSRLYDETSMLSFAGFSAGRLAEATSTARH